MTQLQHLIDSGLGPMQGPMHGGASAPPAWMNKVHDQLYRNVHRHTMQPLHTRNLLPQGAQPPQHQSLTQPLGIMPPQAQALGQMAPQLPWGSPQ